MNAMERYGMLLITSHAPILILQKVGVGGDVPSTKTYLQPVGTGALFYAVPSHFSHASVACDFV